MNQSKTYIVNIYLTLRCNFSCRYCYVKPHFENVDMTLDNVNKLIELIKSTIKEDQILTVNFHGGEPTLRYDHIKYIILRLENEISNTIHWKMTTNSSLLDEKMIAFLSDKFGEGLSISIDGKEKTYNHNRFAKDNNITYNIILNNALKIFERNPKVRIRMTYDRENVSELYENIKFFIDKGFQYIAPVADIFSDNWTEEDFEKLKDEMLKIKNYAGEKKVNLDMVNDYFTCYSKCTGGEYHYSVDPYGNIYPCTFLIGHNEMIIGNCTQGFIQEKLVEIHEMINKSIEECNDCEMRKNCSSYRCIFENYITTGDLYKPNLVECNLLNLKVELLGKGNCKYIYHEVC